MIRAYGKQKGVALIVVLLIVAVMVVLASDITSRNQLSVRRTINLVEYDQAYWYALSLEELSNKVLKKDLDDANGEVNLSQVWAQTDVVFPVDGGTLGGTLTDMRSCFNLNALSVPKQANNNGQPSQQKLTTAGQQFQGLLVALGVEPFTAEQLALSLAGYLNTGRAIGGYSPVDAQYESRTVPFRAAKTLMSHRSELRAVLGFTQDVYVKLAPYICAIPGDDKQVVNVNTLKEEQAPLLAGMLLNRISVDEAKGVINQKSAKGYEDLNDFWSIPELRNLGSAQNLVKSTFTNKSEYFELDAKAKVGDALFQLQSVLRVNKSHYVDVITRQYGGQK